MDQTCSILLHIQVHARQLVCTAQTTKSAAGLSRLLCMLAAGAHNTIVTARAGKDLVSCLVSGLLTIGPRFGGAVDDSARYFQDACDRGMRSPSLCGFLACSHTPETLCFGRTAYHICMHICMHCWHFSCCEQQTNSCAPVSLNGAL